VVNRGGSGVRKFRARAAAAVEIADINTFAVVITENEDGSGARLEVQRALSPDEQDRMNGQDTYCLCTEDGATHYGGVVSWSITRSSLELRLDSVAAATLGVNDGFLIALDPTDVLLIEEGLRKVLGMGAESMT
jgi:hypothetical protein